MGGGSGVEKGAGDRPRGGQDGGGERSGVGAAPDPQRVAPAAQGVCPQKEASPLLYAPALTAPISPHCPRLEGRRVADSRVPIYDARGGVSSLTAPTPR